MALAFVRNVLSQAFPPKPAFTDKDLPDLHGKVRSNIFLIQMY